MKILVALKQVLDTEAKIKIAPDGKSVDLSDAKWITNPYDEYALEEALRLKESKGAEVTVVSVGNDKTRTILQSALALGANNAILLKSDNVNDPITVAQMLADFARKRDFDLILLGNRSFGGDNSCVGPALAELLNVAQATAITKLEIYDNTFRAEREGDSGTEIIEGNLPMVATAQRGLNEPRYASLKGIIAAKKKIIDAIEVDFKEPMTTTLALELPPTRPSGINIEGDATNQVATLLEHLRNETNLI
jgi:electron transfer flavoprotein beta subunit